jgi:hypothetical protein
MTARNWQQRRGKLNHDWLKNGYIPALEKFLHLLDDQLEDLEFEQSFIPSVLPAWETHYEEALHLTRDFESGMSPRNLLEQPPLSHFDDDTRRWLGDVVHELWLARHPVYLWSREAEARVKAVASSYDQIRQVLMSHSAPHSAVALRPLRPLFSQFCQCCRDLARAIERFPCEVEVV